MDGNLIDLVLLYRLHIIEDCATVTFTITSEACAITELLMESIEDVLNKAISEGMELELH